MSRTRAEGSGNGRTRVLRVVAVCLSLAALTLCVFGRTVAHDFVSLDDRAFIVDNAHVREGLTARGVRWAFSTGMDAGFIPLTWISRMLDVSLFGMEPGAHHLVNVLLHAMSTVLLFLALRGMTGRTWECAAAAALFAVHPLHVESVAWVTERKDVLCAFFFMLCLLSYGRYARDRRAASYLGVLLFSALSLLSKPMAVTLPFVLLLLDWWPLGRTRWAQPDDPSREVRPEPMARLVLEKVPVLLLAAACGAATWFLALGQGSVVSSLEVLPVRFRIANAVVSYATYLAKAVFPASLSVIYPHPLNAIPAWKAAGAALLLAALSAAALRWGRRRPYLLAGWLWYLGMLLPVIGLFQAGQQGMADRYTYLPLVGPFVAVAWGVSDLVPHRPGRRRILAAGAGALVAALAVAAWLQVGRWRDSFTLYAHSLQATDGAWAIREQLGKEHWRTGLALMERGRASEASVHYREALRQMPYDGELHANLGVALGAMGLTEEAARSFRTALTYRPRSAAAHRGLGYILLTRGETAEAAAHLAEALREDPRDALAARLLEDARARAPR